MAAFLPYLLNPLGDTELEISPLAICKLLGLFVSTLTLNGTYSLCISENLLQPYWNASKKPKTFSQYFAPFPKSTSNLKRFEKKSQSHSLCIFGKNVLRPMPKKARFGAPFDSQHVKGIQTLVKSAWQHLYHIFFHLLG